MKETIVKLSELSKNQKEGKKKLKVHKEGIDKDIY